MKSVAAQDLTIAGIARAYRDGSLSPEPLVEECLARIERENPRLNAYYEVFAGEAGQAARRASRELREGRDRGPLHGVPIAVKDVYDVAGSRTTVGAHPGFHPPPATEDAPIVARLREAGAVLLGKTAVHEWAMGVTTNNPHFGPTRNPRDPERIPGGSSGGSAAALAAGLCAGATGSDTGGSIRVPAALCGVVGLKPTYGLLEARGVYPLAKSLDTPGPLAGTVEDAFLMLEAMSDYRRAPARWGRVLLPRNHFFDGVDPEIAEQVRSAARRLGTPEEVDVGDVEAVCAATRTIVLSEAALNHEGRVREHPEWFGGVIAQRLKGALELRAIDYARARHVQLEWSAFLAGLLGEDGILVCPTAPIPATVIGVGDNAELVRTFTRLTYPFNLSGTPALSLPCGKVGGLPAGVQLVAACGRESVLYAAARALE
jgi:aspartyl-tRNA(Asn)/glutamyl-tRNA(Gln) amidotransferase subunit A